MYFSLVSMTLLSYICFQSFDLLQKECTFISSEWQRHFLHLPVESWLESQSSSHSVFSGSATWISSLWPCLPGHATLSLGLSLTSVLWHTFSYSFSRRLTTLLQHQLLLNSSAFCYGGIFPLNSFECGFFFISDCISMLSYHLTFVS